MIRVDERHPGTIVKISVKDFMCHSNLSLDLIGGVNFITGSNGSKDI